MRRGPPRYAGAGAAELRSNGACLGDSALIADSARLLVQQEGERQPVLRLPVHCEFAAGGKRREQGCDQSVRRRS